MQRLSVFVSVLAACVALSSASGCFFCTHESCSDPKKVCFFATKEPEYSCVEYTTECGDEKCGWNEKCVEVVKCAYYGHCAKKSVCVKVEDPKKCEEEEVCWEEYGKTICKIVEKCEDFKETICGDKVCGKGFKCEKEESKEYICKAVCDAESVCSCGSGEVCKFSSNCEIKKIHPSYTVFYHPSTAEKEEEDKEEEVTKVKVLTTKKDEDKEEEADKTSAETTVIAISADGGSAEADAVAVGTSGGTGDATATAVADGDAAADSTATAIGVNGGTATATATSVATKE